MSKLEEELSGLLKVAELADKSDEKLVGTLDIVLGATFWTFIVTRFGALAALWTLFAIVLIRVLWALYLRHEAKKIKNALHSSE